MAYLDTPRTDAGNGTYLDSGHNIDNVSAETSFISPVKKQGDLISQLRNSRGTALNTPRMRAPLGDRRNLPAAPGQSEFTPLLKSVMKRNTLKAGKENAVFHTPAFLKPGYAVKDSPALQPPESSVVYGDDSASSIGVAEEAMPLPPVASSSAQSTPMPVLPKRDGGGMLTEQGNMMTLREQENIIDKIEKENFGLKLKIHYLEESLRKSAPDYHQAALKENTELKVDKVTMQKELAKARKLLLQAERDLELYRLSLQDNEDKRRRNHEDKAIREENGALKKRCNDQQTQIDDLLHDLRETKEKNSAAKNLREDMEDLEAELREKDRIMETREDEFNEKADEARNKLAERNERIIELGEQLEEMQDLRDTIEELKSDINRARVEAKEATEDRDKAQNEQRRVEADLNELRGEMADKSFTTKGLSRQIEEKANKLEDELSDLRGKYADLKNGLEDKNREVQRLQDAMQDANQDAEVREQRLKDANERLRHEHDIAVRREKSSTTQSQSLAKELERRTEEKDLLQTRHDALTIESQSLQRDISRSEVRLQEMQKFLEEEKRHALDNDRALRDEAKTEIEKLIKSADEVRRELEDERSRSATNERHWIDERRDLQLQREKAEQKANGLQRTVDKLQQTEGTLSSRESKLQEALESEKQRHQGEEAILSRQIKELQGDLEDKRRSLDENRTEILNLKEELRISKRDRNALEEKVQALEDEVDVLQIALDEESERASQDIGAARQEAESLRLQIHSVKQDLARVQSAYTDARAEIETFQGDLQAGNGSKEQLLSRARDLEGQLQRMRTEKQTLQDQLAKSELDLQTLRTSIAFEEVDGGELAALRRDLSAARTKETESLQREASHKEVIRGLKRKIADLERQVHNIEISKLEADSPKSTIGGSAHKTELADVRRQLADAHQQLKDSRTKLKDAERDSQRKLATAEQQSQQQIEEIEQQRDQLEHNIVDLELQAEDRRLKLDTAEKTVTRLRARIHTLEKDLQAARASQSDDRTLAEERKDLHDLLKDAKLEAEDLQVQLSDSNSRLEAAFAHESDLRSQLARVRNERTLQTQKASALATELDGLQLRYEHKVDEMAQQQLQWEEERKAIVSRVRFPNMSVSSVHARDDSAELREMEKEIKEREKRHMAELRGLAKQIQWLRAKGKREEGFRAGLAWEKRFLLLRIEMFEACNTVDLHMLEEMGVTPDQKTKEKKPTLRTVGLMVLAGIRMQRLQKEWALQKKVQASLVKKAEGMRREKRKGAVR